MALSSGERERYARHLSLPEIGEKGQERLRAGRILVIGAGGLGSPAAYYLAAAGVGIVGVMDADHVEPSNLQRQPLHFTPDIGAPKVDSALRKLRALNPSIRVNGHVGRFTPVSAPGALADYDFIVDCTDNFASKFLIADACHEARKPYSHAGILQFLGQTLTVRPGESACVRCVFDAPPPEDESCAAPRGPLGAVPGVVGAIQATEAVKFLLGIGALLLDTVLVYEALPMRFRRVPVRRNPFCRLCGDARSREAAS